MFCEFYSAIVQAVSSVFFFEGVQIQASYIEISLDFIKIDTLLVQYSAFIFSLNRGLH